MCKFKFISLSLTMIIICFNLVIAKDEEVTNYLDIEFSRGSSNLTTIAKKSLDTLVKESLRNEHENEIIILSWSDKEYPSKEIKWLPRRERELAEQRSEVVEKYIKSKRTGSVDKYNMAEEPNIISKLFKTADYELKKTIIAAGMPTTADDPKFFGKASHAIILIKVK